MSIKDIEKWEGQRFLDAALIAIKHAKASLKERPTKESEEDASVLIDALEIMLHEMAEEDELIIKGE